MNEPVKPKRHRKQASPTKAVRVTFVLTSEMMGHINGHADTHRHENAYGEILQPNRSRTLRSVVGLAYNIPAERWTPTTQ